MQLQQRVTNLATLRAACTRLQHWRTEAGVDASISGSCKVASNTLFLSHDSRITYQSGTYWRLCQQALDHGVNGSVRKHTRRALAALKRKGFRL